MLLLVLAAPAYGQDTGTYISAPLEWGTAAAWVDANADGKADYCRLVAGPRAACTLSTGAGFGATIASDAIDPGYPEARVWGDVDGDHRADYCRRVGGGAAGNRLQCTRSTGDGLRHRRGRARRSTGAWRPTPRWSTRPATAAATTAG